MILHSDEKQGEPFKCLVTTAHEEKDAPMRTQTLVHLLPEGTTYIGHTVSSGEVLPVSLSVEIFHKVLLQCEL